MRKEPRRAARRQSGQPLAIRRRVDDEGVRREKRAEREKPPRALLPRDLRRCDRAEPAASTARFARDAAARARTGSPQNAVHHGTMRASGRPAAIDVGRALPRERRAVVERGSRADARRRETRIDVETPRVEPARIASREREPGHVRARRKGRRQKGRLPGDAAAVRRRRAEERDVLARAHRPGRGATVVVSRSSQSGQPAEKAMPPARCPRKSGSDQLSEVWPSAV